MRVTFNKLVCDRVPEVIAQEGHRAVTHILDDDDLLRSLLTKLVEEGPPDSTLVTRPTHDGAHSIRDNRVAATSGRRSSNARRSDRVLLYRPGDLPLAARRNTPLAAGTSYEQLDTATMRSLEHRTARPAPRSRSPRDGCLQSRDGIRMALEAAAPAQSTAIANLSAGG